MKNFIYFFVISILLAGVKISNFLVQFFFSVLSCFKIPLLYQLSNRLNLVSEAVKNSDIQELTFKDVM